MRFTHQRMKPSWRPTVPDILIFNVFYNGLISLISFNNLSRPSQKSLFVLLLNWSQQRLFNVLRLLPRAQLAWVISSHSDSNLACILHLSSEFFELNTHLLSFLSDLLSFLLAATWLDKSKCIKKRRAITVMAMSKNLICIKLLIRCLSSIS